MAEPAIEPEDHDSDSAIDGDGDDGGDGDASSTTSVTSCYRDFPVENGRSYHAYEAGRYLFPNDEPEQDRLDMQHHLLLLTLDKMLCLAPIHGKRLDRVLDVGTGTGIWAIHFADEHPEAAVYGGDLSPIQPKFVPPNVTFELDNLELDWRFKYPFQLIYCRMMTAAFADWLRFFQQAFENLSPGGFIEVTDICFPVQCDDGTLPADSALLKWCDLMLQAFEKSGRRCDSAKYYEEQMVATGFINVKKTICRWPQNIWPKTKEAKELGLWTRESMTGEGALEGLTMAPFTRVLGWEKEQVIVFLVSVREEMRDPSIHAYWNIYVVYGQKPDQ